MMSNKYPFFKYVTGSSRVHLMNSKMKIIWFLLTFLATLIINDFVSSLILTLFLLVVILNSKINITAYVKNLLTVWWFYVLCFLIAFLITIEISLSLLVLAKAILVVTLFLILTFTTSLSEIAWGFECAFIRLKKIKVPVSKISLRIAMDIKFIATVFEQSKEIRKSMAYRGVSYKKNFLNSFKKMIIPVLSLSYNSSRNLAKIMRLRFYGNSKRRTNYRENKTSGFDKVLVFTSVILIYIVIWLGWC